MVCTPCLPFIQTAVAMLAVEFNIIFNKHKEFKKILGSLQLFMTLITLIISSSSGSSSSDYRQII